MSNFERDGHASHLSIMPETSTNRYVEIFERISMFAAVRRQTDELPLFDSSLQTSFFTYLATLLKRI
jgi:hypothetical protein